MTSFPSQIAPVYKNPFDILLRQRFKHELMTALADTPSPFAKHPELEGASYWLYGSSLMNLYWHTGTHFPIQAKKSLDLDIGVELPEHFISANQTLLAQQLSSGIGRALTHIGAMAYTKGGDFQTSPSQLLGNYLVAKHYTAEEVRDTLTNYPTLVEQIPADGYTVAMDVSFSPTQPPMLLPPQEHPYFHDRATPIKVDDTRNFLAKKLARAVLPGDFRWIDEPTGFKPRDLLDIYNVTHAIPPMLDLDPASPTSDIPMLRCLLVANLCALGKKTEEINLRDFDPEPSDVAHFLDEMKAICLPSVVFNEETKKR